MKRWSTLILEAYARERDARVAAESETRVAYDELRNVEHDKARVSDELTRCRGERNEARAERDEARAELTSVRHTIAEHRIERAAADAERWRNGLLVETDKHRVTAEKLADSRVKLARVTGGRIVPAKKPR